jgi:hypothetical protein
MFGYIMMKELDGKVYNTRVDWNSMVWIFFMETQQKTTCSAPYPLN